MKQSLGILAGFLAILISQVGAATDETPGIASQTTKHKTDYVANTKVELPSKSTTLCNEQETVVFSCSLEQSPKTVSVCYSPGSPSNPEPTMQYRFGIKGKIPELIYPRKPKHIEDAFSFSTQSRLEFISFSRGSTAYDVATPDESGFVRYSPNAGLFSGVEVTLPNKQTQLINCSKKSVLVDLTPIRNMLHIKEQQNGDGGKLSEGLPKVEVDDSIFPITSNETTDDNGSKIIVSYPTINDSTIDSEILKFIGDCDWGEYRHIKGSQCDNEVSASIVKGEYLVIHFESGMYGAGAAHGLGSTATKIYRKANQGWKLINARDLFIGSDSCRASINSMIYRHLKPLGLSMLGGLEPIEPDELDSYQETLNFIKKSDFYPTAQGIEFAYQIYQLGSYAETPQPTLLSWKSLKNCLRP